MDLHTEPTGLNSVNGFLPLSFYKQNWCRVRQFKCISVKIKCILQILYPTRSLTYKQYPRKYCRQSRHDRGQSPRTHLPVCLASPSDVPHLHTQRTSCGRDWEGKIIKKRGPCCSPNDNHHTILYSTV